MRRLLVTGASGTLGRVVAAQAQEAGWAVAGTYHTAPLPIPIAWHRLDVRDAGAVHALLQATRPDAVIHTVAIQRGPDLWPTTAAGSAYVALAAQELGLRLVHLSSDALFDGTAATYTEQAQPSPITPYGAAKAAAETAVAAIMPAAAIVRTSLIICRQPPDQHTRMILDIVEGRRGERLFTDEFRCPVEVEDLAAAVLELASHEFAGVINVAGAEAVSRYELGRLIAAAHGVDGDRLLAGNLAASGLHRPANLRLDLALARRVLRTRLRGVAEFLPALA